MITVLIITGILIVFVIGFNDVYKRNSKIVANHARIIEKIDFAKEYRNKFKKLSDKYFQDYNSYSISGTLDNELYEWLTLNVIKMQSNVGKLGFVQYRPAFENYMINNYPIIINTLPKFREGQIENIEVQAVENCLLKYIGYLKDYKKEPEMNLKNPIVWFIEGFKKIISIPLFILSSFSIFSRKKVDSIMDSVIFKILSGLIALVTFVSGLVTIIVGYDQTIKFINRLIGKQ